MKETLLLKFIENERLKYQKILDGKTGLILVGKDIGKSSSANIHPEKIQAMAYIDAYTKIANFITYTHVEVGSIGTMTNEEALKTAINLFLNEASKVPFNWHDQPKTEEEARKKFEEDSDDDLVHQFNKLIYFWYMFDRPGAKILTNPESA